QRAMSRRAPNTSPEPAATTNLPTGVLARLKCAPWRIPRPETRVTSGLVAWRLEVQRCAHVLLYQTPSHQPTSTNTIRLPTAKGKAYVPLLAESSGGPAVFSRIISRQVGRTHLLCAGHRGDVSRSRRDRSH